MSINDAEYQRIKDGIAANKRGFAPVATTEEWQVFGINQIRFPDSGLECDAVIVTKQVGNENVEIAAVYGDNSEDAWAQATKIVSDHRLATLVPQLVAQLEAMAVKAPDDGLPCWCAVDPRVFDHSERCEAIRAILATAKGATE